jgi:hypothetical protein
MKHINQSELLEALKQKVYSILMEDSVDPITGELVPIHPRDLAAIGNLVLRLQEREDKLKADQELPGQNVVAFPALPPIPQKLKVV